MTTIRALVVEDSLTVRRRIVEVLSSAPGVEVVGEADDGARAIDLCLRLKPDVITIDMVLPVMSGLAATEYIMAHCPTPIVIVSSSINRGDLFRTYDALAAGALEVLEKPSGVLMDGAWERQLIATVRLASRINVITHPRAKLAGAARPAAARALAAGEPRDYRLVAIGASTGGPSALLDLLKGLPRTFDLPVLIVLHIGRPFGLALAEWLAGQTSFDVAHAADGEPLPDPGRARVLLAPPDQHLVLERGQLRLSGGPERHSCRPSVDVLFESIALDGLAGGTIACLLTGMGRDGAQGLLALRRAGAMTIAQDEATSVVFGMPREAIGLGAAAQVLPLHDIAGVLASLAPPRGRPGLSG